MKNALETFGFERGSASMRIGEIAEVQYWAERDVVTA